MNIKYYLLLGLLIVSFEIFGQRPGTNQKELDSVISLGWHWVDKRDDFGDLTGEQVLTAFSEVQFRNSATLQGYGSAGAVYNDGRLVIGVANYDDIPHHWDNYSSVKVKFPDDTVMEYNLILGAEGYGLVFPVRKRKKKRQEWRMNKFERWFFNGTGEAKFSISKGIEGYIFALPSPSNIIKNQQ